MIVLPTRQRLVRRRDSVYEMLYNALQHCSVEYVEEKMRVIHIINSKLITYMEREREPKEIFND